MPNSLDTTLLSLAYLGCLFIVAYLGDRAPKAWLDKVKPWVIGLSLTIYCTAWSYYGTTSQAVYNGWIFPPTFIGAFVTLVLAAPLVRRMIRISKQENTTSIADFLGSRYRHSSTLSISIAVISVVALLPYISLQLKAISGSFLTISQASTPLDLNSASQSVPIWQDTAFYTAMALALFTILFGTRHINRNEHHNGLMLAIAFESIIKLAVFLLLAIVISWGYFDSPYALWQQVQSDGYVQHIVQGRADDQGFIAALVLGAAAILCLPRQFHALVVESRDESDLKPAARILWFYLLVFGIAISPIAYGGLILLQGQGISPEKFALLLPLQNGDSTLATLVYLGGLSAGSSMVIVACIAVSTMICNEIVMPALFRLGWLSQRRDLSFQLRIIRRLAIAALLALSYGYYRWLGSNEALGSIGLLSMALVAQFSPALIAALFWEKRQASAALIGLGAGFVVWTYTLLLPAFGLAGWIDSGFIDQGPFAISWLKPQQLFGLTELAPISNGVLWSLLFNAFLFVGLSHWQTRRIQTPQQSQRIISNHQLQLLAESFLGKQQAELAIAQFEQQNAVVHGSNNQDIASAKFIEYMENLLAGIIGSISARHIVEYASQLDKPKLHSDLELLQETSQIFQYSRSTLQDSIDSISQGISVVDANKQLVAWNKRYLQLFEYPEHLIHVGRPVADLVRYNAERGACGAGDIEAHVKKRMDFLEARTPYIFERFRPDQTVLEIRGTPLPDGGYVTTYTDISDYRRAVQELTEHKTLLEQKVEQRTEDLSLSNKLLAQANQSKTRFLAAAGHDLAQPLNAARLFTEVLRQKPDSDLITLGRIASSIQSAEHLISELLNIAKIDSGAVQTVESNCVIDDILNRVVNDLQLSAREKGLSFHYSVSTAIVKTDPKLLARVIQNLVANAIRYTQNGRVLLGARRLKDHLRIEVWDSGIGIPADKFEEIFQEFKRLNTHAEEGSGLGLATVRRLCELLKHPLSFRSEPGQGSVFRVDLPYGELNQVETAAAIRTAQEIALPNLNRPLQTPSADNNNTQLLLIENDKDIADAMQSLLQQWGYSLQHSNELQTLKQVPAPRMILADYHLDNGQSGLEWAKSLQQHWQANIPVIIISADRTDKVKQAAQTAGYHFLKKPVKPAALRALLDRWAKI